MEKLVSNYVGAIFDLSIENKELEKNVSDARELKIDLLGDDRLYYLKDPDVKTNEKIDRLDEIYQDSLSDSMLGFLKQVLIDRNVDHLGSILDNFISLGNRHLGEIEARVTSAKILSQSEKDQIRDILEKKAQKPVNITYRIDEDILAGFYVIMRGQIFDASLRGRLNDLKRQLGGGENLVSEQGKLSTVLKEQIKSFSQTSEFEEVGTVITVGDGIARIFGLENAKNGELVQFSNGEFGMVLNLEESIVGAVILGSDAGIKEGDPVKLTGRMTEIPVGDEMAGRVVNALGQPIDGKGEIKSDKYLPIERQAPTVIMRSEVDRPLETGIKVIDSLVPIGKGQRELIIGDRQTGKTAIAIDTIINQKGKNVKCVYVAIGQKSSTLARIQDRLEDEGVMDFTTIVFSSASDSSPLQYIAPYAGCSIAEYWMEKGEDVLIIYDDLSKHSVAYRAISLLLGRPPGREAYPGDVFYLHSRLLERAASMDDSYGGGSLTALPIVETQEGDISAYIPTNVISITDGQIFLEADLFNNGIRPAVNPGLSVSRVGGSAQHPAMQKLAGPLRIEYAQFNELAAFSQFGSDLNEDTKEQLDHGERIREVLKQPQYEPIDITYQIVILYSLIEGHMKDIELKYIDNFQRALIKKLNKEAPDLRDDILAGEELSDNSKERIENIIDQINTDSFSTSTEEALVHEA